MSAKRRRFRAILGVLCLTAFLGFSQVAQGCPSCQRALSDGSQGNLAAGIYYSILFMMSMPFAIVGVFGGFAYRAVQRERRRIAEENAKREADESSSAEDL